MEIKYLNQKEFKVVTSSFSKYIKKLIQLIDAREGILNVVFVNDQYIQALNKSYRNKDRPTDVLSFSYDDGDLVGEVYISVETAEKQAKDHNHSLLDELIKLIVHGILHIHGHDHEKDDEYKKMFAIEKRVLGKIAGELLIE